MKKSKQKEEQAEIVRGKPPQGKVISGSPEVQDDLTTKRKKLRQKFMNQKGY